MARRIRSVRRGHTRVSHVAMDPARRARRVGDLIRRDDRLAPLEAYSPQKSTLVSPVNKGALLGPFGPFWALLGPFEGPFWVLLGSFVRIGARTTNSASFFSGFFFARRDVPGLFLDFFFTFSLFRVSFFTFFQKNRIPLGHDPKKKKKEKNKKKKRKKGKKEKKKKEKKKKRSWLNADRWIWERR